MTQKKDPLYESDLKIKKGDYVVTNSQLNIEENNILEGYNDDGKIKLLANLYGKVIEKKNNNLKVKWQSSAYKIKNMDNELIKQEEPFTTLIKQDNDKKYQSIRRLTEQQILKNEGILNEL